jgi:hypothetical protein
MAGLVPAIHENTRSFRIRISLELLFLAAEIIAATAWMAGPRPAMTIQG